MMRNPLIATVIVAVLAAFAACKTADDRPMYEVAVTFNGNYTDSGGTAIEAAIHSIDPGADVRLQESFPPVARTTLRSRRTDVCETILAVTALRDDVAGATCDRVESDN